MNYYKYTFFCERIPNRMTMHSLVTHFLQTKENNKANYNVFKIGKNVIIQTDINKNNVDFNIKLNNEKKENFQCKLVKKEEVELEKYKENEVVNITGLIEYGINTTGQKGKQCPFFNGKFENSYLRNKFKENIEKNLGCIVISMERENFTRLTSEVLNDKIQFNNLIQLNLKVKIENEEIFNTIPFNSFFQKKSYGFGKIRVI